MKTIIVRTNKIDPSIIEAIPVLTRLELEKLVLKAAQMNKSFHDFVLVNLDNNKQSEMDLFEEVKRDLEVIFRKSHKGFSEELRLANMLVACNKRINEFAKICKKKELELRLVMYVLEIPFSLNAKMFGTCFTKYDYQVSLLVKKALSIFTNKIHEDFKIEFEATLNNYLAILHRTSNHLDTIYKLPKTV